MHKSYEKAPIPSDEIERLTYLRSLNLLDTDPDPDFDRIVLLAKTLFQARIAAISLIDSHRQWFKAISGVYVNETPRDVAFCAHTILCEKAMVVPDATQDPVFKANPLVTGDPGIRFYAGVPIPNREGSNIGALCVIDTEPRDDWSPMRTAMLSELAKQVSHEIDVHVARVREGALVEEIERLRRRLSKQEPTRKRISRAVEISVPLTPSETQSPVGLRNRS